MSLLDLSAEHSISRQERSARTAELLLRAHGATDPDERDELLARVVILNTRVAQAIAARYRGRGVSLEDLEQAACEGLVKAVARFDPTVRPDLLTYAVPTMRGEVQRFFRDLSWTVRPPRRIQEAQLRLNEALDQLCQELGREPAHRELREHLGLLEAEYAEVVSAFGAFQPSSLDQPVDGLEGLSLGDCLREGRETDPAVEARAMLSPLLRELSVREQNLLYLRFVEDRTQREIGAQYGVAQMQVSRWLTTIYQRLREQLDPPKPPALPA